MTSTDLRERLALRIAPWLGRRYEPEWDEALQELSAIAYGSRTAIWTSPGVLVKTALDHCYHAGVHGKRRLDGA